MNVDASQTYVAIGASGGEGLEDTMSLLGKLPANLNATLMVVLHRPSDMPSELAEILKRICNFPIHVAEEDSTYEVGHCYIGAPDKHLTLIAKNKAGLVDGQDDTHRNATQRNATIDLLFVSLAKFAAKRAIGVVLSGALNDGSRGLEAIHQAGGITIVLEPEGELPGMQRNAINYRGHVTLVGSSEQIANAIIKLAGLRAAS